MDINQTKQSGATTKKYANPQIQLQWEQSWKRVTPNTSAFSQAIVIYFPFTVHQEKPNTQNGV